MPEYKSDILKKISFRPVKLPEDQAFLKKLYYGIRKDDFEMWSAMGKEQAEKLMDMQLTALMQQYERDFPGADHFIIVHEDEPVGRFISIKKEKEYRAIDLAVLPDFQNLGIGTKVFEYWMNEAAANNIVFTLHVLKTNRAIRLYQRLGVKIAGESGSHYFMNWHPPK